MKDKNISVNLLTMHRCLSEFFGPLHWWPGDSELEIIAGTILTQNTNWQNVSRAIEKIKENKLLDVESLFNIEEQSLGQLIKSCGYFNLKTKRLKNFIRFLTREYNSSIREMFNQDWRILRKQLLNINGIGPETADSILLYAGEKPVFVIDTYTRRIFQRHDYISFKEGYDEIQQFFMRHLPLDYRLYNEFHAQIVMVGKNYCKSKNPNCRNCPLFDL